MVRIINYNSGELEITDGAGASVRLGHKQAHRLVLAARMHNVEPFLEKLDTLIPSETLVQQITALLQGADGSERWNLKEKFARLHTLAPGYEVQDPDGIMETVEI